MVQEGHKAILHLPENIILNKPTRIPIILTQKVILMEFKIPNNF